MATDPRRRAPRPGFVLDVDRASPPVLFHHGDNFRLEKLPADRSRVIYPAEPLPGLPDPDGAIRDAHANAEPNMDDPKERQCSSSSAIARIRTRHLPGVMRDEAHNTRTYTM